MLIKKPAVIGAVISLGNCLNLLDAKYLAVVRDGYDSLQRIVTRSRAPMPRNEPLHDTGDLVLRKLDCAVINTVHEMRLLNHQQPFDSVRAAFAEGNVLYPGASFHDKDHIQICVRNLRCIKGYFRPLPDPDSALR